MSATAGRSRKLWRAPSRRRREHERDLGRAIMSEGRAKDEARPRVDRGLRVLLPIAVLALGVVLWELVVGVGLAVLFNQSRLIEYSLYPYAVILQVTPIVAIAPLLLVYLPQQAAVLACAWIVAFFPVLANTTLGLRSVDHNLADLFRLYGATRRQVLW